MHAFKLKLRLFSDTSMYIDTNTYNWHFSHSFMFFKLLFELRQKNRLVAEQYMWFTLFSTGFLKKKSLNATQCKQLQ